MNRRFSVSTPWYHGWNVIAVGIVLQAITVGLLTYSFTFWVAPYQADLGASTGTIMLAASLSHVALAAVSPVCGRVADAVSIRPLVTAGILVFCIGYFLISVCQTAWQVILVYSTLLPVGASLAGPLPAQVATVRWFARKRGMALGITALGASIGGFVFPPIVTVLVAALGWRMSHVVLGVFTLVLAIPLIWMFMREPGAGDRETADRIAAERGAAGRADGNSDVYPEWTLLNLLRSRVLWAIVFAFVPMLTIYLSYKFNLAPIAAAKGITAQQASFVMAVNAGAAICGKIFFGYMADRIEHRLLVWLVACFLVISLVLPQVSPTYPTLMLSFGMLGLAGGGFLPLMGAVSASRFGANNIGRVIGLTGPLNMIGSFGPSVFAFLYTAFGSYDPVLQLTMLLIIPAVFATFFLGPAIPVRSPAVGRLTGGAGAA